MTTFSVDTHLFRELGQLLVGRDSTALVELIKNAYDADASRVVVYGEALHDADRGFIRITDDGVGMTLKDFDNGFLRIASRTKDQGDRLSPQWHRRFTGAKGIGRLAAHKLARDFEISSTPRAAHGKARETVDATIRWDAVEACETLEEVAKTNAITRSVRPVSSKVATGTTLTLRRLRQPWSPAGRGTFLAEIQGFNPPPILSDRLPKGVLHAPGLFEKALVRDAASTDPGFKIQLEGDFETGDDYWQSLALAASWVIEIEATPERIRYAIIPTKKTVTEKPSAKPHHLECDHPDPVAGPFFQSRILLREGAAQGTTKTERVWAARASGIRVYMEGFRVLPYGEQQDDWLLIQRDSIDRFRTALKLNEFDEDLSALEDEGLFLLPTKHYLGAVFLTQSRASSLQMLVNREGFMPTAGTLHLTNIVRTGVDLATRIRAAIRSETKRRASAPPTNDGSSPSRGGAGGSPTKQQLATQSIERLSSAAQLLRASNETNAAPDAERLARIAKQIEETATLSREMNETLISERSMLRILASVGTQLSAFIHEINGLLSMAQSVDASVSQLRARKGLPTNVKFELAGLAASIGDLRRNIERQASYLIDVVTPDARRRRTRQSLSEKFSAGRRLVEHIAETRGIQIRNEIPDTFRSPPMFPAELTTAFSNLLTNAVKAAGKGGRIRATGFLADDGRVALLVENTGVAVDLSTSETWFEPFESTTVNVVPTLGQGMGLGLTITRAMLEEYQIEIGFVKPNSGYETAVQILFPTGERT